MLFRSRVLHASSRFLERFQTNASTIDSVVGGRRGQRVDTAMRYFKWKKFWNFWRIELQLRMGRTKVSGYPYEWEIDTTNICQLRCPLCQTGLGNIHRDKGVMDFDTYTKVIDEIKDYCIWLTLYSWGEPFLNKQIDRFVEYAHRAGIATIISTNLNKPLTPDMAERVVRAGLDTLIVSLDGTTQEVYEQYRVGGRLGRVLENLEVLVDAKRRLGAATPYIEWQFIVMRQNQHQVPEAQRMADALGVDGIVFKKVDFPLGEEDTELAREWLPVGLDQYLRQYPFERPYREEGEWCWRLWRSSVINWDGGAAPCCYLTDKSDDFGNVTEVPFKTVWNNRMYRSARRLFQPQAEVMDQVGCLTCPVYTGSKAAQVRGRRQEGARDADGPVGAPRAATSRANGAARDERVSRLPREARPFEGQMDSGADRALVRAAAQRDLALLIPVVAREAIGTAGPG